jgi:hypothetical protein
MIKHPTIALEAPLHLVCGGGGEEVSHHCTYLVVNNLQLELGNVFFMYFFVFGQNQKS